MQLDKILKQQNFNFKNVSNREEFDEFDEKYLEKTHYSTLKKLKSTHQPTKYMMDRQIKSKT